MLHLAILLVQTASSADLPSPPDQMGGRQNAVTGKPCNVRDVKGRPMQLDPAACEKLASIIRPLLVTNSGPHTLLQLGIDTAGKVESCTVAESSGAPKLDARACAIAIEKAHYAVTSKDGRMRRQTVRMRISWPANLATLTAPQKTAQSSPAIQDNPALPPRPLPVRIPRSLDVSGSTPRGETYGDKLAAQRGIRGRNAEQGWTISD